MRRNIFTLIAIIAVVVVGASCASTGPQAEPVPPTKTPKPTFTPTSVEAPVEDAFATATIAPADLPTATSEALPTEAPAPTEAPTVAAASFTTRQNVNVRSGPGTDYAVVGQLAAGQGGNIIAVNNGGTWLQFAYNGDPAWVIRDLVNTTGDVASVQIAQNIPTPPPAPTARPQPTAAPQPTQPPAPAAPPAPTYGWGTYVEGSAVAAPNCGTVSFSGISIDAGGGRLNGVCILIDYYGPRQIKFSGSGGQGDGNWGFAPCGSDPCTGPIKVYVVECPGTIPDGGLTIQPGASVPAPASSAFTVDVADRCTAGQWTGITFRKNP